MSRYFYELNKIKKFMDTEEEVIKAKLKQNIDSNSAKIEKDIAYLYQKYAKNKRIDVNSLLKDKVNGSEVEELTDLKEEVKNIDYDVGLKSEKDYKNMSKFDFFREKVKLLNIISGVFVVGVTSEYLKSITKKSNSLFKSNLKITNKITTHLDLFTKGIWIDDTNFMQKIFKDKKKITEYLIKDVFDALVRGDSYESIVEKAIERFKRLSFNDAYRLIYTEGSFILNQATYEYLRKDFEFYKIVTAGDKKVCPICKSMQSKSRETPFRMDSKITGVNFPPFHPWCRCVYEVVVDLDKLKEKYKKEEVEKFRRFFE